ncbi:MAG: 16S rRNA (cytidine(1402)-2'-O)-methyltransferase [Ignavibacteriaceae bacterium]|jgi:16S rRNA (cytidine1402-2'-O)-methyltransferase|nr:16S rRNA (cytidine(1402)-2'-O)-methyltransferase [Ignavibacteriaceae bacterium]MCW8812378.1 16S rRNA (cytidine(1402)-2'-O)-methyltransferase [Chlorobium sp.]MCW8995738.1 16S rRNA (cytidine(1402)-2'-O)-methyltransferase [Psychromonas sp.]MCW8961306.1 16S rRNA (cytidine(1402)-2'-O)-methyltransferase [Ignavibacteriaceae bacterium]MCW9095125.1 16S rRNA (cytidine(1402)-2'-O)-methyltransferase [Ignavibacteriaceae bacterium]
MKKTLYIVSVPIGNYDDITLRALNVLRKADFIICEEYREARRLLSKYKIEKKLVELNEHNEEKASDEILQMILNGKSAALISDCGTPLFSDPGHLLVDLAIQNKIDVIPIPGVSSLLAALVGSGLDFEKFYYYGWLSPKKDIRRKQLLDLKRRKETIVLMDTPYRLKTLMEDVVKILGVNVPCVLAFELTKEREKFYRGNAGNVLNRAERENLKGEFVLIIQNR